MDGGFSGESWEQSRPVNEVMTMSPYDTFLADRGDSAGNGRRHRRGEILHCAGGVTSDWAPLMDTTDIDEATELLRPAFFPIDIAPCGADSLRIRVKAEQ